MVKDGNLLDHSLKAPVQ